MNLPTGTKKMSLSLFPSGSWVLPRSSYLAPQWLHVPL